LTRGPRHGNIGIVYLCLVKMVSRPAPSSCSCSAC
jgi:hypothetical protein